ncbi:Hypothetical predicted protein, partial [Olea europaea subsp. europaea]
EPTIEDFILPQTFYRLERFFHESNAYCILFYLCVYKWPHTAATLPFLDKVKDFSIQFKLRKLNLHGSVLKTFL